MEFQASTFAACLLLMTLAAGPSWAASWSYKGETGTAYWHELFPQACSGKHQSPINIKEEETLYDPDLRDFAIWYDPPRPGSSMQVLNNGHTVQVAVSGKFHVTNAGLPNVYTTAQFHFHWGDAVHHGSEHLINSHAYPLELHIVNYNSDLYDNIGAAVTEKQGLAVLGVMFEVTDEDNEDLEPVIAAMQKVRDPDQRTVVEIEPLSLRSLLPRDISSYFRYNGSLTTPGCFESVIWTVFSEPQYLSRRQMEEFRKQMEASPSKNHHKRSARSGPLPASRSLRRRERRALEVLDELALSQEEEERFKRDLAHKKQHAQELAANIDERDASESHRLMAAAVHTENHDDDDKYDHDDDDDDDDHHVSEVEVEFMREYMANNFRPVQPVNDRLVYRSFKLRGLGPRHHHPHHHHKHHSDTHGPRRYHHDDDDEDEDGGRDRSDLPDHETLRQRLKMYESLDSAAPAVAPPFSLYLSLTMLLLSCLAARRFF